MLLQKYVSVSFALGYQVALFGPPQHHPLGPVANGSCLLT